MFHNRIFVASALLCGALAAVSLRADEAGQKVRAVVEKHKQALGILKLDVEVRLSVEGGSDAQSTEASIAATAFAIDGEGLYATADHISLLTGGFREDGVKVDVDIRDSKMLMADGKEFPARVEWRDTEHHLLFLRVEELKGKVTPVDLADESAVDVGDPCVLLQMLTAAHRGPQVNLARIDFRFDSPLKMLRVDTVHFDPGIPAFDLDGKFLGVTSVYKEPGGDGDAAHAVVLRTSHLRDLVARMKHPPETGTPPAGK